MAKRARTNPFYPLLVAAGIAFTVTACAYGVMAIRAVRVAAASEIDPQSQHPLLEFLEHQGEALLLWELAALAAACLLAMATDRFWNPPPVSGSPLTSSRSEENS